MNRKSLSRQLALFPTELLTWESLSQERQEALRDVLSLLLEQMLQESASQPTGDSQHQVAERNHV